MGSIKYNKLNSIVKKMWHWCDKRHIFIFASYINTLENCVADKNSKIKNIDTEYSLNETTWWLFCRQKIDKNFSPKIKHFFYLVLKSEFEREAQYSTRNSHRFALNLISEVGKADIVSRFMRGVFKLRPNFPKYHDIWDPEPVLRYLKNLNTLEKLTLEKLIIRFTLLLARGSTQIVQTLSKIRANNIDI